MSSKETSNRRSNVPTFRCRGLSILLIGTLVMNVILVSVALVTKPEQAAAHSGKAQQQRSAQARKPKTDESQSVAVENSADGVEPTVVHPEIDLVLSNGADENPSLVPEGPNPDQASDDSEHPVQDDPETLVEDDPQTPLDVALVNTDNPQDPVVDATQPSTEPVPVQPDVPEVDPTAPTDLVLVNPAENGGVVHYLVDGVVHSLAPGAEDNLGVVPRRVEFHRGEAYGEVQRELPPGTYFFRVSDEGWTLSENP